MLEHPPIVCVVGRSGAGKTSLLERLIPEFHAFGLRIAAVKHGHDFRIDQPGKDSWRLAEAGASVVLLSSPDRVAVLEATQMEWPIERLIALAADRVDLFLTEGYKAEHYPKIEVARAAIGPPMCCPEELLALVSSDPVPGFDHLPRFSPDDVAALAHLVMRSLCLCNADSAEQDWKRPATVVAARVPDNGTT